MSIAVCLCTCRRPQQLRRALQAIACQDYAGPIRVVVMENHAAREGSAVCAAIAPAYPLPLQHGFEPQPGLAHARNAVLRLALAQPCDFIAMMDDDEWPEPDWLTRMMATQASNDADIVGGPAEPVFETPPAAWMVQGEYFRRTGASFSTGNLLLRAAMLRGQSRWFDPQLNFTGHEDHALVQDLAAQEYRLAVNEDAVMREGVPDARANLRYILARGVREGNADIFVPELRGHGMRRLARLGMKFLYALNHLAWSPLRPWRFFRALDDFASCVGMVLGMLHYRYQFYATQQDSPRRIVRIGHADRLA